jgi:hypothetical protein
MCISEENASQQTKMYIEVINHSTTERIGRKGSELNKGVKRGYKSPNMKMKNGYK